jgi:REP element-mobilizing transposase RayT
MEPDARKFRKHLRVKQFDYTSNCAYFVTLCTENRRQAFGEINDGKLEPTRRGMIVQECWNDIPNHHPFVQLDAFILMPNHIHGVLVFVGEKPLGPVVATPASPQPPGPAKSSLGSVVGSFKSAVSRKINKLRPHAADGLWQVSFYDHVVRNDRALDRIREYILSNPERWNEDELNEQGTGRDRLQGLIDSLTRDAEGDAGVATTG